MNNSGVSKSKWDLELTSPFIQVHIYLLIWILHLWSMEVDFFQTLTVFTKIFSIQFCP